MPEDAASGPGAADRPDRDSALGDLLIADGKLEPADLARARRLRAANGESLSRLLTKLGLVSDQDMVAALSKLLAQPVAGPRDYPEVALLDGELSAKFLKEARAIPLADQPDGLVLAMADPLDDFALNAVRLKLGREVLPRVALPADIEAAFERLYGSGRSALGAIVETLDQPELEVSDEDIERLKDQASEAPVIRLVNALVTRAVEQRASDIHIEPFENKLRVRYRVDGVLAEVAMPPAGLNAAIVSRIKIMANLNIAERRFPQDGRITLAVRGKEIELRVSTMPTVHGEGVVLRILDRDAVSLDFDALGFDAATKDRVFQVLRQPNGIVLVTGPTGSGKTTTLYAALAVLNTPDVKIVTIEDPVEYQLEGINQIQVKPQIELTFASLLRSILRHDPNIIMVGEVRDLETAQIGVQAALTGHLVLSTLHTNSAAASIVRLLDMGLESYLLGSTINGILAQRLVRLLCPGCREPYRPSAGLLAQAGIDRVVREQPDRLYRARGCEHCHGTGYRGRSCVTEMLVMSEALRELVLRRAPAHEIEQAAVRAGMRTLFHDGLRRALAGDTSLEEVLRVTREG